MFITKKHLSRRHFLTGMGATVALPFLESMVPAQTPIKSNRGRTSKSFGLPRDGSRKRRQHPGGCGQELLDAGKRRCAILNSP